MSNLIKIEHSDKQIELIKQSFGLQDVGEAEFTHFMAVAKQLQLDPLTKQIYAIPYKNRRTGVVTLTIMTSIDGARAVAARTETYAGVDAPVYTYNEHGRIQECSVTVYRIVQGVRCPFINQVDFSEYNTGEKVWASKPKTMIAKVAEMGALRKAFPQQFSKIYESAEINNEPIEEIETVSGEQQEILHSLTMIAKPEQDSEIAYTRVGKIPARDFADYALMGVERLHEIDAIDSDKRDRLVQMIHDGESILNELPDPKDSDAAAGDE